MGFMAPAFNAEGITFVSAGYRHAPQHEFPAALADCVQATKWVAENIARHGGHRERIFIGGHSAGGHYAALLAVNNHWTEAAGLSRDVVRRCLPPFLVAHGTRDFPHLIAQAGRFVSEVRAQGGDADHLELANRTHFTASYAGGESDGPWVPAAIAFMARYA
jgi:acetyl esterase/lipase